MVETKKYLLYVDDDPDDQLMLVEAVREISADVRVACAMNGVEALRYLNRAGTDASERPALILMDINMPLMNGMEALAKLKSDPVLRAIPVVMFTTSSSADHRNRCLQLGAADFLTKPFERAALQQIVKRCLTFIGA